MIRSLYNSLYEVVRNSTLPLSLSILALTLLRVVFLIKNNRKFVLYREVLFFFFEIYLVCLFEIVTDQDINITSGNNFVPFLEIQRYEPFGRLFIKNIVGNVLMFVPLGIFLGRYTKNKCKAIPFFFIILFSFSIECTQLLIGRVFDVDDIILNVIGGLLGYTLYLICKIIYKVLPNYFKKNNVKNISSFILLIIFIIFIVKMFM